MNSSEFRIPPDLHRNLAIRGMLVVGLTLGGQLLANWFYKNTQSDDFQTPYHFTLDLRTATTAELQLIPGFGPTLSQRWVDQRDQLLQQYSDPKTAIKNLHGIGAEKFAQLLPYVRDND